jgi:hypothetical protein
MLIPLWLMPAILTLLVVSIAGFTTFAFLVSLINLTAKHPTTISEIAILFCMFVIVHAIITPLLIKTKRSSSTWIFLGLRKRLWQYLIPLAYIFGVIGAATSISIW